MLNSSSVKNNSIKLSKTKAQSLMVMFKDLSSESKLRKGLKQTYKSAVRNHLKLAVLCKSDTLSTGSLLDTLIQILVKNKTPFFYVNSLNTISSLIGRDYKCSCAGLVQVPKNLESNLTDLTSLLYDAEI